MDVVNSSKNITDDHPADSQYWQSILIAVTTGLISVTGLIGNSAVILAVAFSRKLQTAPNALLTNLAIADLMICFFLIWWVVGTPTPEFVWPCAISSFMLYTCNGVTLFTLTAIAVNRLVYITKNDLYKKLFPSCMSWKMCIMLLTLWILPFGAVLIPHLMNLGHFDLEVFQNQRMCTDLDTFKNSDQVLLVLFLTGFIIPSLTIFICYIRIFLYLRNHFRKQKQYIPPAVRANTATAEATTPPATFSSPDQQKQQRILQQQIKITKNLFIVVCAFVIVYTPFFMNIFLISQHLSAKDRFTTYLVDVWVFANSALNLIIYAWNHPDFKIVLRHMMKCSYAEIPEPSRLLRYILSKHQEVQLL